MATPDIFSTLSRRTVVLGGIALIIVIAVATALTIWLLRTQALARAEQHLRDLAVAIDGHADQSIHSVDLIVSAAVEEFRAALEQGREPADGTYHRHLRERVRALPHVRALAFIDRDGNLRAHSELFPVPAVNYADRDYFQAHRDRGATGLHVGEPVLGRTTKATTYTFSRRVEDARGAFRGVVVAAAELEYFHEFYRRLTLGQDGRIFTFRSDGVLLTSYPVLESAVGRSFAADPLFGQALATSGSGVARRTGFVDAKPRLIAYRQLEDEPVVVAVSMTQDHVLADWRRQAFQLGAGGAAMVVVIGLAMLLALRQLHERAALKSELAGTGEQLRRILDAAMDAVITVDEEQRIVIFNTAAEKIFRFPAGEAIGQPLDRLIPERFRAAHRGHVEQFGRTGTTMRMMGGRLALFGLRATGEEFPIDASISQVTIDGARLYTVILRDITERKRAEEALERSYRELHELSSVMHEVREAERLRIAHELHDELAQWLTAIKMDISWLASRLPRDQAQLLDKTDRTKALVDTTVAAVRRIAADLRPVMLDDLGLVAALESLLHDLSQRTGIIVSLDVDSAELEFREPLVSGIYRMAQEALTNVARHAGATEVQVRIRMAEGDRLVLTVHDNGRGFDPEAAARKKSYGVLGIRERAHTLGGAARIEPLATGGTVVEIVIPVARYRRREAKDDPGIAR